MTPNEVKEAVYSRFITAWGSETAYVFGNEEFTPPVATGTGAASWVRLLVREVAGGQETLGKVGSRSYRRRAQIILMVYALPDRGEQRADALVKKFRDYFEGASFSGVDCFDCQVVESGNEGLWYRVNAFSLISFCETK